MVSNKDRPNISQSNFEQTLNIFIVLEYTITLPTQALTRSGSRVSLSQIGTPSECVYSSNI